ncbi:MAG: tRNA lysidine(34) synthetase TilS [Bdellovibrionales bacterium]|nr:tRNA lysidine(34) synthetase TilS [Bdellovibrionales bacterium]
MFCNLEHQLLSFYKNQAFKEPCIYLAVSGGLDSMAMLELHNKLKKILKINLIVLHVHHGFADDKITDDDCVKNDFRNKAYGLVKDYCKKNDIKFLSNAQKDFKKDVVIDFKKDSEEKYRKYRYDYFEKILLNSKFDLNILVTAHTSDDLLETRLMRLMRGVGPQGFASIKAVSEKKICNKTYLLVRPLLNTMRFDLKDYVKKNNLTFCQDPSNKDTNFLRNWLRLKVLPVIAKKDKKYIKNMSQSLNLIANKLDSDNSFMDSLIVKNKIKLSLFHSLSLDNKKQALAHYLYCNKIKNYSMGHVLELLKYADATKKQQSFSVAKQRWELKDTWLYMLDNSSKSTKLKTD